MRKSEKITVLIVDDVADTRENLRKLLYFERDITVVADVGTGEEGIQKAKELHPDTVLMDINLPGIDGISAAEVIRSQSPNTQVVMMSVQGESEYLRRAMLAGAREFLVKPFSSEELAACIRRVHSLARESASGMPAVQSGIVSREVDPNEAQGKVVTLFSAKGGVGRTTVACNLAIALHFLTKKKVALVDSSLQFGDVGILLNLQSSKTIVDLVPHLTSLEAEMLDGVLVSHSSGIKVLLGPPKPEMAELITAEAMKKIVSKLRENYDFVIVDTWPSFQDTILASLDLSDRIILLMTLEIPAIKNAKLFLEVTDALGYPRDKVMLVLNRADSTGGIRISDVEESLRRPIPVGIVSDGRLTTYALNRGIPFVISNPDALVSKGIVKLAENVSGMTSSETTSASVDQGGNSNLFSKLLKPRLGFRRSAEQAVQVT